jgi:hypothetical protein
MHKGSLAPEGEWNEYKHLVLWELDRLNKNISKIGEDVDKTRSEQIRNSETTAAIKNTLEGFVQNEAKNSSRIDVVEKKMAVLEGKAGLLGSLGGIAVAIILEVIRFFLPK